MPTGRPPTSRVRPFFDYGQMLRGASPEHDIRPHIERTERATAPTSALSDWPVEVRRDTIDGEVIWVASAAANDAMKALDAMKGPTFRMARVRVSTERETIDATSLRWRGPRRDLESYLTAAERKVEIAEHELANLRLRLTGDLPSEAPVALQADFEGVLHAFSAAVDQVAEGLGLGNRHRAKALPDVSDCVWKARDWLTDEVVGQVATVRNRATHGYYDKRARGGGIWDIWTYQARGERSHGDVESFAGRAVMHLGELRPILMCLRSP